HSPFPWSWCSLPSLRRSSSGRGAVFPDVVDLPYRNCRAVGKRGRLCPGFTLRREEAVSTCIRTCLEIIRPNRRGATPPPFPRLGDRSAASDVCLPSVRGQRPFPKRQPCSGHREPRLGRRRRNKATEEMRVTCPIASRSPDKTNFDTGASSGVSDRLTRS